METEHRERFAPTAEQGLSDRQVQARKAQGLFNRQPQGMLRTNWQIVCQNLFTLFNAFNFGIALCIAWVGAYENLLFLLIIIANLVIGIVQEIRSKQAVEKLSLISAPRACVVREGKQRQIATEELVLDDVMVLQAGNQICADAVVLTGEVECNEALLTGEADPILKCKGDLLLSGSFLVSGTCKAQVEHVGEQNYATQIAAAARAQKKFRSELMADMQKVIRFTSAFLVPIGILLFCRAYFLLGEPIRDCVVTTSAAVLGMLPKGLVLLTSISLAVGVVKLARKRTLVQELYCIETLSRVDVLCLDKTGTITQGKMAVAGMIDLQAPLPMDLAHAMGVFAGLSEDENATQLALRAHFPAVLDEEKVAQVPFSSARKWSCITTRQSGSIVVGAPDILMKDQAFSLPVQVEEKMQNGARVLMVAHSDCVVTSESLPPLTPMGFIFVQDPVREDAAEILRFFREQGVQIKIISGDNPVTIASVARQAGLSQCDCFIDASTLHTEAEIAAAAQRCHIFGRVTPEQKKQLIQALKALGHTVAMVGDGVNDVLALKEADCSVAMAAGSDAARQVSQLVLMDSNFSSLPAVVMEGRRVVNNITRTASLFLLKTTFSFLLSFITLFSSMTYPFSPIQLSVIGSMMQGIPAFFLALEPSRERIRGNFLYTVLHAAFPSGFLIAINIVIIHLLSGILPMTELDVATLNVYMTGLAAQLLLVRVCRPLNRMRGILCVTMMAGFFALVCVFHEMLGIALLNSVTLPVFVVMGVCCVPARYALAWLLDRLPFMKLLGVEQETSRERGVSQ